MTDKTTSPLDALKIETETTATPEAVPEDAAEAVPETAPEGVQIASRFVFNSGTVLEHYGAPVEGAA